MTLESPAPSGASRVLVSRALVAAGLLAAWFSLAAVTRVAGLPNAPVGGFDWVVHPASLAVASVAFVASTVAFALRLKPAVAGPFLVALLGVGAQLYAWQWPADVGVNNGVTLPAVAVLAWSVVRLRTRRDADAHDAACGIVAAAYSLAALSKLLGSGVGWAAADNIALHVATHAYADGGMLLDLRLWVANSPVACAALGVGTFAIEGSAVAFLWPRARPYWACAAFAMHLGISLLMGLHHYDWALVMLGLGLARKP